VEACFRSWVEMQPYVFFKIAKNITFKKGKT